MKDGEGEGVGYRARKERGKKGMREEKRGMREEKRGMREGKGE